MSFTILFLVFLGGAAGSLTRYFIGLSVEQVGVPLFLIELVVTAVVNLSGASLLGFVHSQAFKASQKAKAFWGSGFAGGFTTMSGLALITIGQTLGLSDVGYLYWIAVAAQFVLGIMAYWFVRSGLDKAKGLVD